VSTEKKLTSVAVFIHYAINENEAPRSKLILKEGKQQTLNPNCLLYILFAIEETGEKTTVKIHNYANNAALLSHLLLF